ncbi:MAG: aminoacyl-tRNA hydrolase [bacterium]
MTIFGLGNPGPRYARTRHNVGFMTVDILARRLGVRFHHLPGRFIAQTRYANTELLLVKPLLYMNESGVAVKEQLATRPDDFLVIVDDLTLPLGRLRLRAKGSDGGHKGLASIIYHLETKNFPRLRIGIGAPEEKNVIDYVLSPFTPEETKLLPEILQRAADSCLLVVTDGLQRTMNLVNAPAQIKSTETTPTLGK